MCYSNIIKKNFLASVQSHKRFVNFKIIDSKWHWIFLLSHFSDCTKTVLASERWGGFIQSPDYPLKYKPVTHCEWNIKAPSNSSRILLQFTVLKLEGQGNTDQSENSKSLCFFSFCYFVCIKKNVNFNHIYPTPPLGQDMTQSQFLSRV